MNHAFSAVQFSPVLLHHSVICGFYKLHCHVGINVVTKDLLRVCVLEGAQINRRAYRTIVQISDVSQDNLPRANIKILFYRVQRSRVFVVVSCLMLVGIFLGPVGHQVHRRHDSPALFDTDTDIEFAPQIGLECTLARNKPQFSDDLPEQFLQFILAFPFFCLRTICILLTVHPGIIARA